ncbi:hypothetical protein FQA39_LY12935 [Lamprigera yunnana]|nr:hypothetical protein FQA39_LY12935 [Lamprigera yunnana]
MSELNNELELKKDKKTSNAKRPDIIKIENFDFFYNKGKKQTLFNINMDIKENAITSFIGPSGCGKTTLLRSINRMNDLVEGAVIKGTIRVFDNDIYAFSTDVAKLRTEVGMVFQRANPFPTSIFENVVYGPKQQGCFMRRRREILHTPASGLSGGQQQRLCIARAIAMKPNILLMDEPTSALDPIATLKVEELILELKKDYTIVLVTHSLTQAKRISDMTAYFLNGELVEYDRDLQELTESLENMIEETKIQYAEAFVVLKSNDEAAALMIVEHDRIINDMQNMAKDLRLAVGGILISKEIERIADYSKNIAKFFAQYKPTKKYINAIIKMFELIMQMLDIISNLFANYQENQAEKVNDLENQLNSEFVDVYRYLIKNIRTSDTQEEAEEIGEALKTNKDKKHNNEINFQEGRLNIFLVVGVNGTGKTTSLSKIANLYAEQGKKVLIAAADTFRAGAVEQLED